MRFDPQANFVGDLKKMPAVVKGGISPVKTALVILGVGLVIGLGLWLCNDDLPHFKFRFKAKAAAPEAGEEVGAEVVKYAEAVMSGKDGEERLQAVTGSPLLKSKPRQDHYSPRGQVREEYDAGMAAMAIGQNAEAAPHFLTAIQLEPDYAEAHYRLGLCYVKLGLLKAARKERAKLEKLNPDLAMLLASLVKDG